MMDTVGASLLAYAIAAMGHSLARRHRERWLAGKKRAHAGMMDTVGASLLANAIAATGHSLARRHRERWLAGKSELMQA